MGVESTPWPGQDGGREYPLARSGWGRGTPWPGQDGARDTPWPGQDGGGVPQDGDPCPGHDGGGVPHPGVGYPQGPNGLFLFLFLLNLPLRTPTACHRKYFKHVRPKSRNN